MTTASNSSTKKRANAPDPFSKEEWWKWFVLFIGAVAQTVVALANLRDPSRTIIWGSITVIGLFLVYRQHKNFPGWAIGLTCVYFVLYVATSPSGQDSIYCLANSTHCPGVQDQTKVAAPASLAPLTGSGGTKKYVVVSVFLDSNGDGFWDRNEDELRDMPITIGDGEPEGYKKTLVPLVGTMSPQAIDSQGRFWIGVCGISQVHEFGDKSASIDNPLKINVGILREQLRTCRKLSGYRM